MEIEPLSPRELSKPKSLLWSFKLPLLRWLGMVPKGAVVLPAINHANLSDTRQQDVIGSASKKLAYRIFVGILAVGVIVGFALVMWGVYENAFRGHVRMHDVPLIKADLGPVKIRPDQPGGLDVPHKDSMVLNYLLANKPGEQPVEKILSPSEEPVVPPSLSEENAPTGAVPPHENAPLAQSVDPSDPENQSKIFPNNGPSASVPVIDPGTLAVVASGTEQQEEEKQEAEKQARDKKLDQTVKQTTDHAKTVVKKTNLEALPSKPVSGASKGKFAIQLMSSPNKAGVENHVQELKKKYPDMMQKLGYQLKQAEIPGKGQYYRLTLGHFQNKAEATKWQNELKTKKIEGFVVTLEQ